MRRKPELDISISLVNTSLQHTSKTPTPQNESTTYRAEGLSIGPDYMRYLGHTLSTALSPSGLTIESTIGRGSCSIVKRARDVCTGEPYALKIFPIRCAEKREMMVKELRALCRLRCDCLVGLIGAFFDCEDGTVPLVLEYMDRGSIEDLLKIYKSFPPTTTTTPNNNNPHRHHGLPERAIASLSYQILWGLSYLHYEKILHRDVKPANVLINSAGQVKLTDFGISKQNKNDDEMEMNVTVVGTARYMSPERLRAKVYGFSSDIWSVGMLLLECVTGRSLFDGMKSVVEVVQTIEETPLDDMIPSCISEGLDEILRNCLNQSPERRIPASILMKSPWFEEHDIRHLDDAVERTREFIEETLKPQNPSFLSTFAKEAMRESTTGLGIYSGAIL